MELAEDEMKTFGKVWISVLVSMSYCYIIGKITSKGFTRLIAVLPIIYLFIVLPINLTFVHLCGFTAFFITWLANFKLLLFAFGKQPLCCDSDSPIPFSHFITVGCLPIQIRNSQKSDNVTNPDQKPQHKSNPPSRNLQKSQNTHNPDQKTPSKTYPLSQNSRTSPNKSAWIYIIKAISIILCLQIYNHSHLLSQEILSLVYVLHVFFTLEIVLASLAKLTNIFLGLELEPQFNEPLLSTSLQDFWGKRWNLVVTSIIKPLVFQPVRDLTLRALGPLRATQMAVMVAFVVSALMHELLFFYLGRVRPTFEITWYFLVHGLCLCLEITIKVHIRRRWQVPRWVSCPATMATLLVTSFWLFMPPLMRSGMDAKALQEYKLAKAYVKRVIRALVSQWIS